MTELTFAAPAITSDDVRAAAERLAGRIRPATFASADPGSFQAAAVVLVNEFSQHTGTFKARGAANLACFHLEHGSMPEPGVVIASGGNAGLACAWAAKRTGTRATIFLPETTPAFKAAKLRQYDADVRLVGTEYADALEASIEYARDTGALLSHAYDHPLIAAGAGTLGLEILSGLSRVDTIIVAVGGGGLFSGIAAAVHGTGIRVVAVEPENCNALHAAIAHGGPVDVPVNSIAADSLGARWVSEMAYRFGIAPDVTSVLVTDEAIVAARRRLWDQRRVVVEHAAAAALAGLASGAYVPDPDERVAVVLCGANTDPVDLVDRA